MRKKKAILLKKIKRKMRISLKIKLLVRKNSNGINLHKKISKAILKGRKIRISFPILIKKIRKNTNL